MYIWLGKTSQNGITFVSRPLAIISTIHMTDKQTATALNMRGHTWGCANSPVMTIVRGIDAAHVVGLRCRPKRTVPSDEDAIAYQPLDPPLVCCVQVAPESVDV